MADKHAGGTAPHMESQQYRMYSPTIDVMMREVLHTLGDIDFQHQVEMERLERSADHGERKSFIVEKIKAAHLKRRAPYVDVLTALRKQQHRMSFAA